jgi:N-acetylneuraminic acid mutarotase
LRRASWIAVQTSLAFLVSGREVRRGSDLPTPRGGVAAFFWPSLGACLVGGESTGGTNAQLECVTADGRQARLPDLPSPRRGLGAAVVDGTLYVVLGGRQPGLFVSDAVEALELP